MEEVDIFMKWKKDPFGWLRCNWMSFDKWFLLRVYLFDWVYISVWESLIVSTWKEAVLWIVPFLKKFRSASVGVTASLLWIVVQYGRMLLNELFYIIWLGEKKYLKWIGVVGCFLWFNKKPPKIYHILGMLLWILIMDRWVWDVVKWTTTDPSARNSLQMLFKV